MSFPKRKKKSISTDGEKCHWLVGPNDGYNVFVAEKIGVKGRRIEIVFPTDINSLWLEFPNTDNLNLKIITPKDSESIIRQALHQGWNLKKKEIRLNMI